MTEIQNRPMCLGGLAFHTLCTQTMLLRVGISAILHLILWFRFVKR